jgi:hypothetical protein
VAYVLSFLQAFAALLIEPPVLGINRIFEAKKVAVAIYLYLLIAYIINEIIDSSSINPAVLVNT